MKKRRLLLLALPLIFALQSCSKTETENETSEEIEAVEYLYFVSGKMNGEDFIFGQRSDDTTLNFQLVSSGGSESATCAYSLDQGTDSKVGYATIVYPNFDDEYTQPSFGIYFDRFYRCSEPEDFNTLFPIDDYEYSINDQNTGVIRQIGIGYSPIVSEDKYYESYTTDQSDGTFSITSTEANNSFYGSSQSVEGEFSITLYANDDVTDTIEITEGKFKLSVSK